jgi:DNA-binding CsgD family transcriptional regulator
MTPREYEVLRLLAVGKSTKEISAEMVISINTAKAHIKSIYKKVGLHSRGSLMKWVAEQ